MRALELYHEGVRILEEGKKNWLSLIEELKEDTIVLLFTKENTALITYLFLLYLSDYISENKIKDLVILTDNKNICDNCLDILYIQNVRIIWKDYCFINSIVKLYEFLEFTNRLIICSVMRPESRLGDLLINRSDILLDEIVGIGVYRLRNFKIKEHKNEKLICNLLVDI